MKLVWLVIPAMVFFWVLVAWLARLPQQPSITVEAPLVQPSPPPPPPPAVEPSLSSLFRQISTLKLEDPEFSPPNFDRQISLPAD